MRRQFLATAIALLGANLACQSHELPAGLGAGGGTTGAGGGGHPTGGGNAPVPAAFQYDGSLAFAPAVVVVKPERVEISAPIVPRTDALGGTFPTSLAGEQAMAHAAALLFDWLLPQCAPLYPTITLAPSDGSALSPAQLATNYDQVGLCAYQQYVAKPYWIPKLVDDVDICGTEMGAGWRLITEADLASFSEADFQNVADTWNLRATGGGGLGFFFSTLAIWVRADDGIIKAGTLAPGVTGSRVAPLELQNGFTLTDHYEGTLAGGPLGLRCIRRMDLP
jgi:hypothetical protein